MRIAQRIEKKVKNYSLDMSMELEVEKNKEIDWPRINFLLEIQKKELLNKLSFFLVPLERDELRFVRNRLDSLIKRIDFKVFLAEVARAKLDEAKRLLFLARYRFVLKHLKRNFYWECCTLLNSILLKMEAACSSFPLQKITFETITKENYLQKKGLLQEIAQFYRSSYRAPVPPSGLVKRSLRGDDVNDFNEFFYRLTTFLGMCAITMGAGFAAALKSTPSIFIGVLSSYIGFYLWCHGHFKRFKLYRKKPYSVHEFAVAENIEKRFSESKNCCMVVAKVSGNPTAFFLASDLHLVRHWPRIIELAGSFTVPGFQGKGITTLLWVMIYRNLKKVKTSFDYILDIPTTFNPIVTVVSEAAGFKPIALEIGGLPDSFGYYSENCKNVEYANYLLLVKDFFGSGVFQKKGYKIFVLSKYGGLIKKILRGLHAKRTVLTVKEKEAEQEFEGKQLFLQKLEKLKGSESSGLFIDLREKAAAQKMHAAEKSGFYFCGILPGVFQNKQYSDFAYYRYLSEERVVYPFMSIFGIGIPDKMHTISDLRKTVVRNFNRTRKKNRLIQSFAQPFHWRD